MCCLHRATSSVTSAFLLSLAVNKKSVLGRGGTYQPLKVEHRDRLAGHKTKQFASRRGSGVVKRNVFFHIISFFFFSSLLSNFPQSCQQKYSSSSESVSGECRWQFLTIVFLRLAPKTVWGEVVVLWQQTVCTGSSDSRVLEAAIVAGWHTGSKEKAVVDAASNPGLQSTLKLFAQDTQ